MEKKKKKWEGEEPKGVTVPRLAHERYEKAQKLRDARAAKRKQREDVNQAAARITRQITKQP